MARQKSIHLSGQVGKVIFYERNGTPCARTSPESVKQTRATIACATTFGRASHMGGVLRKELSPLLPNYKELNLRNRFTDALAKWLRGARMGKKAEVGLPFLSGYQFNEKTSISDRIKVSLTVNWSGKNKVSLTIPALDVLKQIAAPANTTTVHWKIVVCGCSTETGESRGSHMLEVDIPYTAGQRAEQVLSLPFVLQPQSLSLVALAQSYAVEKKRKQVEVTDPAWMPVGIIDACYGRP